MLDILKSKFQKTKAPVKTAPLKLGFLDEGLPNNEFDSDFVIVPESAKVKEVSAEVIGKNETSSKIEEIETIAEPVNEVTQTQSPDIGHDQSDGAISGALPSFPSAEPADESILANPGLALEIKIPEEVAPAEVAAATLQLLESGSMAAQIEHDAAVTLVPPESLPLIHALPDLKLIDPGDAGVKEKGRYDDAMPQILEIARSDPRDYGWKYHSLRNLQKYLIAKKIVKKISHETLRNILSANNIQWNGNGYPHKKKSVKKPETEKKTVFVTRPEKETIIKKALVGTMVVEDCAGVSDALGKGVEAMGNVVSKAVGQAVERAVDESAISSKKTIQMLPGSSTGHNIDLKQPSLQAEQIPSPGIAAKPYYPMILTDYHQPPVAVTVIKVKNEKLSENIVIIDNPQGMVEERKQSRDVSVPPDIIIDINNIKIYGTDFDPGQLEVVESYSISHPIESPRVYIVKDGYKLRYLIKEPEKPVVYDKVRKALLRNVDIYPLDENKNDPVARLTRIIEALKKKYTELKNLNKDEERRLLYYLYRDFIGYREIDAAMRDEFIEDITCVGYGIPVFIYHQKYFNLVSDIVFQEQALDSMVLRMAQESGKHISISEPIVDAALKDGSRAQLTYKKTATDKGSTFTVRRFKSGHITPIDLIKKGTYSLEAMAYLWKCVQRGKNVLFVGGTATGKTTNLNACSFFIPPEVKIVSIEDTREIKLYQKNWIPSVATRDIDVFQLLKASLRQRPEYIIVGEVRGKEAQTLFQAMSSGHIVMSTFHAGSVGDLVNRLTSSPIEVPSAMLESLDIVVILKNEWTGVSSRHRFADAIYEQRRISETPRFVKIYDHVQGLSASLMTRELEHKITCLQGMINEKLSNPDRVSERIISHMYSGVEAKHD
jgi:flagellar protein FlaI